MEQETIYLLQLVIIKLLDAESNKCPNEMLGAGSCSSFDWTDGDGTAFFFFFLMWFYFQMEMTDPIPFPMLYHFHPVTPRRQAFRRDTLFPSCLNAHIWTSLWNRDKLIDTLCKPEATEVMVCEVAACSGSLPGYLRALRVRPQTTVAIVGGVTFTVWSRSNNNTQQWCLNIGDKASGVGFTIRSFTLRTNLDSAATHWLFCCRPYKLTWQ